jgi:hypothetical protein
MSVMDEQVPGQQNPIQAMLAKIFGTSGQPGPSTGMPSAPPTTTAAVTPLATTPQGGAPPPNMPPGVSGVPSSNSPVPAGGPTERAMPSPNAMLGGNFSMPNKSARNAAVVSTGIENMSEAIHNFKVKKDTDEFQRAKNTWDLYQKAATLNPQTGQPVDPHTMEVLKNDPKIVKGWEKYLKMQFPREAGAPDAKTGKAQQGQPIIPPPTADPAQMAKQLQAQKLLEGLRSGSLSQSQVVSESEGATALSPEDWQKAMKIKYGLTPSLKQTKEDQKLQSDIDKNNAEISKFGTEITKLDAETARLSPNDPLRKAQITAERALAVERLAQAQKDLRDTKQAKTLQEFTVGRSSLDTVLKDESKNLTKMQSTAMAERSKFGKMWGSTPDVTPEQDAQQNRVTSLHDAYTSYIGMQDDVTAGRITPSDALAKARRGAGLTSTFDVWSGVPSDAPQTPPKELPEGYAMKNSDGVDVAVKQGNKWVAP